MYYKESFLQNLSSGCEYTVVVSRWLKMTLRIVHPINNVLFIVTMESNYKLFVQ